MPSKRDIINNIDQYERRIREHEAKIARDPGGREVSHWKDEIAGFKRQVASLRSMLNEGGYDEWCPVCKKTVKVRNRMCIKCSTHLG
jgi:hypothetical protein